MVCGLEITETERRLIMDGWNIDEVSSVRLVG